MLPLAMIDAVSGIYDAALNPALWPSALRQISALVDSTTVAIALERDGRRTAVATQGISPEALRLYATHFRAVDPVRIHLDQSPAAIYSSRQVVPKHNLYSREIYGDYGRLYGLAYCMQGYVIRESDHSVLIAVCRPTGRDEFEPAQAEILAHLVPHLRRALKIQMAARSAELQAGTLAAALDNWLTAVLVVNGSGRLAFANRGADCLLVKADGICIQEGRLCATMATHTAQLHGLLKRAAGSGDSACEGGSMLLERASGRRPLSLQIVPCPALDAGLFGTAAQVLVFASDPESADKAGQQRLQELYKLTRSEAALAELISTGVGVKAAARLLGIAPSTARTHLRRTFEKTGAGRQAELANLVGSSRLSGDWGV